MLLFISFRQIVIVLGVIFVLRLIGKVMSARRNINEQNQHHQNQHNFNAEKEKAKRNFGKTTIHKINKNKINEADFSDYEEVD